MKRGQVVRFLAHGELPPGFAGKTAVVKIVRGASKTSEMCDLTVELLEDINEHWEKGARIGVMFNQVERHAAAERESSKDKS